MKLLLLVIAAFLYAFAANSASEKPKLILVISIDQFRADYLQRFQKDYLPAIQGKNIGGFNYLMQKGSYFSHAEFGVLQNMTAPGHATILTGSYPYQNGIPGNDWVNSETKEFVYCTEDRAHTTVGASPKNVHVGTSPKNLIGTTVGDELKNAYPQSKVVSLALKDRSAILMGGHRADLALWFDSESFKWVSSSYYLSSLPAWVETVNGSLSKQIGQNLNWKNKANENPNALLNPENKYLKEIGVSFPHNTKVGNYTSLLFPLAVDMPVQLAKKAIDELKLGQGNHTDILAVSFSNHDYVGHSFGSESAEVRETTLIEDKKIAELLNHVKAKLPKGLDDVWIVLTADHGVADTTEILSSNKIPAGRLDQAPIIKEFEKYLKKKYGVPKAGTWMLEPSELNFFINRKAIAEKELSIDKIQDELVEFISSKKEILTGIAHVFSGADVKRRTLPAGLFESQILRTYFKERSGDIMMIPLPNFVVSYGTATHMSGYSYDRYVPLIFSGKPFKQGTFPGGHVVDIAPTLSFLLGIIPPTNSEGKILEKALK